MGGVSYDQVNEALQLRQCQSDRATDYLLLVSRPATSAWNVCHVPRDSG